VSGPGGALTLRVRTGRACPAPPAEGRPSAKCEMGGLRPPGPGKPGPYEYATARYSLAYTAAMISAGNAPIMPAMAVLVSTTALIRASGSTQKLLP